MTKKVIAVILSVLMLAAVLAACGGEKPAPDKPSDNETPAAPERTIRFSSPGAQDGAQDREFDTAFANYVSEKTGGRIAVDVYHSSALGKTGAVYDAIVNGTADAGSDNPETYPGLFPYAKLFVLPAWYYGSPDETYATLRAYSDAFPDTYMQENFKVIAWEISPSVGVLTVNKPLTDVSQLKGFTTRAGSGQVDWLATFGANGVNMSMPDVYESFRLNVIDGCITGVIAFSMFSLPEVCNYFTYLPMINGTTCYAFSKPIYDSQDSVLQSALDDAFEYGAGTLSMNHINAEVKDAMDFTASVNPDFKFVDLDDEQIQKLCEAAEPIVQETVDDLNSRGLDGNGAYEWLKAHSK